MHNSRLSGSLKMRDSNAVRATRSAETRGSRWPRWGARCLVPYFAALIAACVTIINPIASSAEETEEPAWDHTQIEKQVVDLLAAGKQSDAEALLNKEVDHIPEAVEFATIIAAGRERQDDAIEYLEKHGEEVRKAQRLFFLFGAVTRSRFEVVPAMQILGTALAMDPTTPSARCALDVIKLDSRQLKEAGPEKVDEVFRDL